MDRPERTQAAGDASRRQGTPGAAPEPGQPVFRGRQVAEVPAAGPSPSRTEPQATRSAAGVSESPGGPVSREAGRAGHRFQPYSAGEHGRRPGASLLPAGEPSVPPVPQGGRQEPELPARYPWKRDYEGIEVRIRTATERGDTYAVAASVSALREIDQAVMEAYSRHPEIKWTNPPGSTPDALQRLRCSRERARRSAMRSAREADQCKSDAMRRSLDDIYRLTQAKSADLRLRSDDFQAASPSCPVPDPESLGRWLQAQAEAAHDTDMEKPYFAHLAHELHRGRDPLTASREFMGSQPSTGTGQQAERLQEAHGRLVRAIAHGLSERPSVSGGPEPPKGFRWQTAYDAIKVRREIDARGVDHYAATASAAALQEIGQAVMEAYFTHRAKGSLLAPSSPTDAMKRLRNILHRAGRTPDHRPRVEAIRRSVGDIYRLTHARFTELEDRRQEFRLAFLCGTVPVAGREALGRWLQAQADAAPGTAIEQTYFNRLEQQLRRGRDPWTVSRDFMKSLPSPDNAGQAQRLQDAHRRLVQAMAGGLPLETAAPMPIVAQPSGESRAPVSMQQGIVERLNSRNHLSVWQVRVIMSAVRRAFDAGKLNVSTSRPEAWAKDLVGRVQISVQRPFGDLTESERELESSDLKRLGELAEQLGGMGYL